jgi:hypothetical protein
MQSKAIVPKDRSWQRTKFLAKINVLVQNLLAWVFGQSALAWSWQVFFG